MYSSIIIKSARDPDELSQGELTKHEWFKLLVSRWLTFTIVSLLPGNIPSHLNSFRLSELD